MLEFVYFYGTPDDWPTLLHAAISNGLSFYVDDWYSEPAAARYGEVTAVALAHLRSAKRRVFLVGDYTTEEPFFAKQELGDRRGSYFIDSTRRGVTIALTLPTAVERPGKIQLQPGSVHLRPEYWAIDNTTSDKPPASARDAYSRIVSDVKAACQAIELARRVWLGPVAYEKFTQASAILNLDGSWLSRKDVSASR